MEKTREQEIPPLRRKRNILLFGVRRSIRYHIRRRKLFERLDFLTKFLAVIGGSGTIISVSNPVPNKTLAVFFGSIVAFFAALDLVVGCSKAARAHHDLIRKFSALEQKIILASGDITESELNRLTTERLKIEEEEPPTMRILNVLCHNELVKARGLDKKHLVNVAWPLVALAHISDFGADGLQKQMDKIESSI
jgi:hypothetical protein